MADHDDLETKAGGSVGAAFEDFMRAFEAYKDTNDERLDELERRSASDPLVEERLARIDRALDETKRTADRLALKAQRPHVGGTAIETAALEEHRRAFHDYVRKGEATGLHRLEQKALAVTTNSGADGGYLVPPETERAVTSALKDISPIRGGPSVLVRVTEIGERGLRDVEGLSIDPDVYWGGVPRDRETSVDGTVFDGAPYLEFLDLPVLRGDEPPEDGYVAAYQLPWPGSVAVLSSPEDTGFVLRAVATAPAVMGVTMDPLPMGPLGVFDFANRARVSVTGGELSSVTRLQLLAGANLAAIKNEAGGWEVLQFETAELVAAGTYELSGLLRGQGGTELERRAPLTEGAVFVLLSEATRVSLSPDEVGLPLYWRYGPASRPIADQSYTTEIHAFRGRGLKPLAPVHVRGVRTDGDLEINWIRRTRVGGDSWDVAEVPLSEESERYEVDILDGSTVLRTIAATVPQCVYTASEQTDDFGSPQSTVDVAIYQVSAAAGRGTPSYATV